METRGPTLRSKFVFERKQAAKLFPLEYYQAQALNRQAYKFIEEEKNRLGVPRTEVISEMIDSFVKQGYNAEWDSPVGKVLKGIYEKNRSEALDNTQVVNSRLNDLLSKRELLLLVYKAIKGNNGTLTKGENSTPRLSES